MALTTEQEEILEKMIEAFENGKRLSDLPDVGDTSPFELYTEVLDSDGESKKARLASLLPYVEDEVAYGVQKEISDSSPTCTRTGNLTYHKTLPVQSLMRGCLLGDDGKVTDYLPDSSWEGYSLDGSRGQVMVELPQHWRKVTGADGVMSCSLSLYPLPGYELVPRMYVSAYEATVERSTNKLCSVKNTDPDYRGGNNNADYDGTNMTLLGRPATYISLTNFRAYARNRGAAGKDGCGWNAYLNQAHVALYWLFVVEYATLNCQLAYNAELTAEGYRQGGLGNGVTTLNSNLWSAFNGSCPFVPCGHTDSLGNGTGYVEYEMPEEYGATLTVQVPRYRGVENPFGHIFKRADGVIVEVNPSEEDGGSGLSRVFTCADPAKFSSTLTDDYSHVCNEARSNGYTKEVCLGKDGDIFGTEVGGSSTTYFCDYHYINVDVTAVTIRCVSWGGYAHLGASAGFVSSLTYHTFGSPYTGCGSRLCFLPE